ncbi:MAG: ethanolamine ammonia-lyase reactivating factor EutA [Clostridia bacterium]|nr:ethanolamine ammonia-lyase reactivating factor EutA [Clostridia bacterium]
MAQILSVGIDIGTSTTQVVFSRIEMDNTAGYFTAPRIAITGKEILYKSRVYFTPLKTLALIDADAVREIVAAEFAAAGYTPADTQTGAVIITGESARKENAASVLQALSDFAGEFVVSTAGPDLESIIAGKGSGAWQYSIDNDCTVVNLDIGGGTSNIVFFNAGDTQGKICLDVGGRLIRLENAPGDPTITYISYAASEAAKLAGVRAEKGSAISRNDLRRICDAFADCLAGAIGIGPKSPLQEKILTPGSDVYAPARPARRVCFSGGVADCIYSQSGEDDLRYGDIGPILGRAIAENRYFREQRTIQGGETIRATVVGAGTYTTNLSGSTIFYSEGIFPVKNVPALKLTRDEQWAILGGDRLLLADKVRWFLQQSDSPRMLLALQGLPDPDFAALKRLAEAIVGALDGSLAPGEPIIVVVERDIAKALGIALQQTGCRRKLASIDSVKIEAGDYVDIGRPLMDGLVVPVVVKTLLFG